MAPAASIVASLLDEAEALPQGMIDAVLAPFVPPRPSDSPGEWCMGQAWCVVERTAPVSGATGVR